ncbi:MAG: hypothetical protein GYB41_17900, partial [Oceanospirillales bacterium]|nr:hypothetical protein [Oceanospirillales bacterium]
MRLMGCMLAFSLLFSANTVAQSVDELFPYAAQSHASDGELVMKNNSTIFGTDNGRLNFAKAGELKGRCDNQDCRITGKTGPSFTLSEFKEKENGDDADCGSDFSRNRYDEIKLKDCTETLSVQGEVFIETLKLENKGVLYLEEGTYWIEELELKNNTQLIPKGKVTIYVGDDFKIDPNSTVGTNETPENLIVFVYDDAEIKGAFYGYIYVHEDLKMDSAHAKVNGAVNAGKLEMNSQSSINYVPYPSGEEPLEPSISSGIGYVYGNATIRLSAESKSVLKAKFIASHSGSGMLTIDGEDVAKGEKVILPLNQDILVSYDRAEQVELDLLADDDNIAAGNYKTELTFVPRQLKWVNNSTDCGAEAGFNYDDHKQSCQPLAKAGQPIPLTLQAYGEGNRPLTDYSATIEGIEITELNASLGSVAEFDQAAVDFSQTSESQFYSFDSSQAITHVALIQASVPSHCAPYAKQGDDCLL